MHQVGSVTADLQKGTTSVIGGPITVGTNGDIIAALINGYEAYQKNQSQLQKEAEQSMKDTDKDVKNTTQDTITWEATAGTDSGAGKGPTTSAQAGSISVSSQNLGGKVVTINGGSVTCGPNEKAVTTLAPTPAPAPSNSPAPGTSIFLSENRPVGLESLFVPLSGPSAGLTSFFAPLSESW